MEIQPANPANSSAALSRRTIPLRRKLAYVALVWIIGFGLPELMLRLFWSPAVPKTPPVGTRQFLTWLSKRSVHGENTKPLYRDDPQLLWRLDPGIQIDSFNHHFAPDGEEQSIRITINEDGYRGRKLGESNDGTVSRVLCLGDSNFFGYPLDDQDALPYVLEATLNRDCPRSHWEVVNAGVPGYTVVQGWRWYQSKFQQHHFDVLMLSFLNNEAWRQPNSDADLLLQKSSSIQPLAELARQSRLVNWTESWFRPAIPKQRYVPRVSREDYASHYRLLVDAAQNAGTRVVILDYRAYDQYEPYSQVLRQLADEKQIEYIFVGGRVVAAVEDSTILEQYPSQKERVERRWGSAVLSERPYLWYYAEYHPEHLNELGVAWFADQLSETLCREKN
mgnify:CR=1 FL=1